MDVGQGSPLRLLGLCVFALVFASNVTAVEVCPLLRRSLKKRSLENCCLSEGK